MDIASIVILILFLLLAIIGFRKGFISVLLGIAKGFVTLIVSFFLAKPVGGFLYNSGLGNILTGKISDTFFNRNPELFGNVVTNDNKIELIKQALTDLKIPEFFRDTMSEYIGKFIGETDGLRLCDYLGKTAGTFICIIIAYIVLCLTIFLILFLLQRALKDVNKIPVIGVINRALGIILEIAYGYIIICFIFWLVVLLSASIPEVSEYATTILALDKDGFGVAKWLYEHNIAIVLFEWFSSKLGF